MELEDVRALAEQQRAQIRRVVMGHEEAIDLLMVAVLSSGHVLLEGMPGTAKTLLAHVLAMGFDLEFKRIQFTPDLMPGDVLGTNIFNFQKNEFVLTRGPIFTQLLLADEINRTPPKTQAALLQAMQERTVTIDGVTHDLGDGFLVVATQNPIELEGTYPLPEAQLDRFLLKIEVDYPDGDEERRMVRLHGGASGTWSLADHDLAPLMDLDRVRVARRLVAGLELADEIVDYVVEVVRATRAHPSLAAGASPRATNMLCLASRALAALDGRSYVIPDDVKRLVGPVLGHRLVLAPGADLEGTTTEDVLAQVLEQVPAPR